MSTWSERAANVFTPNYKPAPVVLARGDGVWLWDTEGRRYLDFAAGIAVCGLGHNHPALVEAISKQVREVVHVSNIWLNQPAIELAEGLCERSFAERVYFGNSGAEANEAAMKLARRYMRLVRGEDRFEFICAEQSFHGRTWAAISATGQPKYHKGFGPLVPGFTHVPYDDLAAMEAAITPQTCAIMVEPLQGEGGLIVPSDGYLKGLRALCDQHGILLILDEVQTGVGRTGKWFCYQHTGVAPDIMSLAKGLGGGVPIGAMVCTAEVAQGFEPGAHASTFGGNPLACRAGLTVLEVIEREGLIEQCAATGEYLAECLAQVPGALGVRGQGLLRGIVVDAGVDRPAVRTRAMEKGLLMTQAGKDVLRFSPPLVCGRSHVEEAVEILSATLKELGNA